MLAVAQWTSGGECVSLTSLDPNSGERLMRMLSRSLDPKDCIDPNPTQFDLFIIISDHGMEWNAERQPVCDSDGQQCGEPPSRPPSGS